jgi:diguanylate cyclase (GGDEF)-like protein/PAS domain S-box-containing protein
VLGIGEPPAISVERGLSMTVGPTRDNAAPASRSKGEPATGRQILMLVDPDPRVSGVGPERWGPRPKSNDRAESASSLLSSLLSRYPTAQVAAIDESGTPIPVPTSVPLGSGHTAIESTDDLIVEGDRPVAVTLFARARIRGIATNKLRLDGESHPATTVHAVDCRAAHGAIIIVSADDMVAGSGEAVEWKLPPLPPRLARAHKDGSAVFTAVDSALCEILGWSADQLIGRRALEIVHPDDHEMGIANWVEMLATPGLGRRVRLRHQHRDGHWVWLEITNHNRLDDVSHRDVVSEMVDISDEMAAHAALEEREQLLHELAETVPLGLFHSDPDGRILFANRRLLSILRVPEAGSIDDVSTAVHPADRQAIAEAIHQVKSGLGGADLEVRIPSADSVRYGALSLRAPAHETTGFSGFIGCLEDVTDSVRMRHRMEVQANYDALTECHNRSSTMEAISARVSSLNPTGSDGLAVLYVDLDRFKVINDAYGHSVGDQILRITAERLRHAVRMHDIVGRVGGDEFVVVCSQVGSEATATRLAASLKRHLCVPADVAGRPLEVSASIGVAWANDPTLEVDALVDAADSAMYASKRASMASEPPATIRIGN